MTNYPFDHESGAESARLEQQAKTIDPFTERLLRDAGLQPGMKVLDLGCGAGDVTFLAATIVGTQGSVTGVDRSPEALNRCLERAARSTLTNVSFGKLDIGSEDAIPKSLQGPYDAIIGRFVLQFVTDPAATVEKFAKLVSPGGLICFQEVDDWYNWSYPDTESWTRVRRVFLDALSDSRVEQRMGLELYRAFTNAKLAPPQLRLEAPIGGGSNAPVHVWANVVLGALHSLDIEEISEALGSPPEQLLAHLTEQVVSQDLVVIGPPLIGAWTRL